MEFRYLMRIATLFVLAMSFVQSGFAQRASLYGTVSDELTGEKLLAVNIYLVGTTQGAATGLDGDYSITDIKPSEYTIQVTSIGYEKQIITGIVFEPGEKKKLDIIINQTSLVFGEAVKIIGEKPLVDIESSKTGGNISQDEIAMAPTRQIQNLLNTQTGVIKNPEGINIRGGRTYETGFYIDDVSASDPLAGTGFGIDIGTNSIKNVEVTTGGAGVEYGNATAGIVNTQTRDGGDKFELDLNYKRDNFGFNEESQSSFNQQVIELGMGGPLRIVPKK
ncbi:MAG: hypothetical protein ACI959_002029, partial [Limisphaerales bacterium]